MSGIVQHLERFARRDGTDALAPVSLRSAVAGAHEFVAHRFANSGVDFRADIAPEADMVLANQTLLEQVLLNLLTNALDSTDVQTDPGKVEVHARREENTIMIEVRDNGTGLDPRARDDVFKPFFTTKPQGHGLGLGLSISKRIVEDLGGTLDLYSTADTTKAVMALQEAS